MKVRQLRTGILFAFVTSATACGSSGIVTKIPLAPSGLSAVAGDAQITLSWTAITGSTSYRVLRATSAGGPYTYTAGPASSSYIDTGLTNGTTYYYVVTAVNTAGESGYSNEASATPRAPAQPPAEPSGLLAIAGDAQVTLSWNAGVDATSFHVLRATTTGGPYVQVAAITTALHVDTGLTNGTTYYYVVTALNTFGESGYSAQASARPQAGFTGGFNIGLNLEAFNYWMAYAPFVDMALLLCGNDQSICLDSSGGTVEVDSNGYPTTDNGLTATWAPYPDGDYAMTWDGTSCAAPSNVTINNNLSSNTMSITDTTCADGHYTATLHYAAPSETEPGHLVLNMPAGISHLHIMAPSELYDAGHIYLRDFLRRLRPFSTLRFMDLLNTNGSTVSNWSDRAFPGEFSHARGRGLVYEDVIALANETGKDVWFNIPVFATDDYICRLARLFRYGEPGDKLDAPCDPTAPSSAPADAVGINAVSHIYLEYSNELWNYGFTQAHALYCMVNGLADWGSCADYDPGFGVTTPRSAFLQQALANTSYPWLNTYEKAANAHGVMLVNISQIFGQLFGDRPGQIRVVAASQNAGSAYGILDMINGAYGEGAVTQHIYAIAVAPYVDIESDSLLDASLFGVDPNNPPERLDFSSLFEAMSTYTWTTDTSKPSLNRWTHNNAQEAASYGVKLISYEGGPGLTANADNSTYGAKYLAQHDPGMRQVVLDLFSMWQQNVGQDALFTYYSFTGGTGVWGYWGALEDFRLHGSRKWDTLLSLALPVGDADLDGLVTKADCDILTARWGQTGSFWEDGDFNHDGTVDTADLALLNASIAGDACAQP